MFCSDVYNNARTTRFILFLSTAVVPSDLIEIAIRAYGCEEGSVYNKNEEYLFLLAVRKKSFISRRGSLCCEGNIKILYDETRLYTVRRCRPFARRLASTFLPRRVSIRRRNPCVRALFFFRGCQVRSVLDIVWELYQKILK